MKSILSLSLFALLALAVVQARSINVNLFNQSGAAATNQLTPDLAAGQVAVGGEHWNNLGFANDVILGAAAKKNVMLKDDGGNTAAARFESTLNSAYVGFSGASAGSGGMGNRNLMASYLSFKPSDGGHLEIRELGADFTDPGYRVYVYFDTDNANRTHTLTLTPAGAAAIVKVGDDSGTYSGSFIETRGAGNYANMAVFENITASSFTLAMDSNVGRAAVNGIQIVSNDHVFPPTIEQFTVDSYYVSLGSVVELNWQTTGASSITIDPSVGDVTSLSSDGNGSTQVQVSAVTRYTLTASNEAGSISAELRVGVGEPKPNILFFLVDDMGWQDTSVPFHYDAVGNPIPSTNQTQNLRITPNMETLAEQGMKFTSAYAYSVCSPTRVSIMTGMNSARHHVTTWTHPDVPQDTGDNGIPHLRSPQNWRKGGMDETDIALPKLLQDAGYRTIHAGKAHFGTNSSFAGNPQAIGFDINIAGHGAGGPGSYLGTQNYGSGMWRVPGLEDYYGTDTFLTEALTLEMNKAIEKSVADGVPFFAYMSHYAVHVPWVADPRFTANYPGLSGQALAYATLIEGMDKSLGDIMTKLEALGVAENTIVIFYSDNGSDAANPVLRGRKGEFWEGGVRVPLLAAWAKPDPSNGFQQALSIPAQSREDDIVSCEDMFATVASIAGASYDHPIDGHDLTPYLRGQAGTHRPQEFIEHFPHGHNHDHFAIMRQGDWKVIHQYGNGKSMLFNLVDDIGENHDLASRRPGKLRSMVEQLKQRLEEMDAQYSVDKNKNEPVPPVLPAMPDVGFNVNDPHSFFLHITQSANEDLLLTWPSAPGIYYTVQVSPDLREWTELATALIGAPTENQTSFRFAPPQQAPRFFRVELE